MANICNFSFQAKGRKESIRKVLEAMEQKTKALWIGRGAEVHCDLHKAEEDGETGMVTAEGSGWCKWSVRSCLDDAAKSMETQRTTGGDAWAGIEGVEKFMTIGEACRESGVNMEIYSEEPGNCFAEHAVIADGRESWGAVEYREDWDEETGEYSEEGGYGDAGYSIGFPGAA